MSEPRLYTAFHTQTSMMLLVVVSSCARHPLVAELRNEIERLEQEESR